MYKMIVLLSLLGITLGCGYGDGGEKVADELPIAALGLNDGAKWSVDAHTRDAFTRMGALVAAGPSEESSGSYQSFGGVLHGEAQELIGGCRLTGPAHDELHVLLAELLPRIAVLRAGAELAESRTVHGEIRRIFAEYETFFE